MLVIRQAQMQVLYGDLLERWVAVHLREHFPRRCAPFGEAALLQFVRDGIAAAHDHGFSGAADACRYVQVALHLGAGFDGNGHFPWASALLADTTRDVATRIELLQAAAADYLRRGPSPVDEEDEDEIDDEAVEPAGVEDSSASVEAAGDADDEDDEDEEEEDEDDEEKIEDEEDAMTGVGGDIEDDERG